MWGRGVVDDKGQVYIHAKAIEAFVANGGLPINLKMIVEGEEEVGSVNLDGLLRAHAADLAADFVCVSDTAMFGRGIPSLCVGLRGLAYVEVFVEGPRARPPLGLLRWRHPNPVNALAKMIAQLHDDAGRVTVPGFYDAVRPLTAEERRQIAALPFDERGWLESTGAPARLGRGGLLHARAHVGAADARLLRHHRRLPGRGREDHPARPRVREGELPPRARPGARRHRGQADPATSSASRRRASACASSSCTAGGPTWRRPTTPSTRSRSARSARRSGSRPSSCARAGASPSSGRSPTRRESPACSWASASRTRTPTRPNEWLDLENYHLGIKSAAYLYDEIARMPV